MLEFQYGFELDGKRYGWKGKELYRLPFDSPTGYKYGLKKLTLVDIGNKKGYAFGGMRKTAEQLKSITKRVDYVINNGEHPDLPFIL